MESKEREMKQEQLRFVVASDRSLDFELIEEAWIGDREVADVRQVDGEWQVTFFPNGKFCELSWEVFAKIYQEFSKFVTEQSSSLS